MNTISMLFSHGLVATTLALAGFGCASHQHHHSKKSGHAADCTCCAGGCDMAAKDQAECARMCAAMGKQTTTDTHTHPDAAAP